MRSFIHSIFRTTPLLIAAILVLDAQENENRKREAAIDVSSFFDSSHHWYDIKDEERVIDPLPGQQRYKRTEIRKIADNILLYQKSSGGWPKNYDMLAILTEDQRKAVLGAKQELNTTFDNGATHSHIEYLARAYDATGDERYKNACLKGLDFVLQAQYPNGGWPQFYPDTSGYRKHITFNDGAMIGILEVLHRISQNESQYAFVDADRREKITMALQRGIDCVLRCQIKEHDTLMAWCQQHDHVDFRPMSARTYELASICGLETAEIVLFLMSLDHPSKEIKTSIESAVSWYERSAINGIKVEEVAAPKEKFIYHTVSFDRVVVQDPSAPRIWARFYELETKRPLFCNRDGKPVYSLKEVERERRTGYGWYTYEPEKVLKSYPEWKKKWNP
ncbi:MAG: pectate lyase [Bacteroidota bacterium]